MTKPLEPSSTLDISQTIMISLFSHKQIVVEGNPTSIDMLKEVMIRNSETQSIHIYEHKGARRSISGKDKLDKLMSLNYTQIKEIRKEKP